MFYSGSCFYISHRVTIFYQRKVLLSHIFNRMTIAHICIRKLDILNLSTRADMRTKETLLKITVLAGS